MPGVSLLVVSILSWGALAAPPAGAPPSAFLQVLSRRGVDEGELASLGLTCAESGCKRLEGGRAVDPALSPQDLDALLALRLASLRAASRRRPSPRLVALSLALSPASSGATLETAGSLERFYDGAKPAAAPARAPAPAARPARSPAPAPAAAQGPSPEALERTAALVFSGKGGARAYERLTAQLRQAAMLPPERKPAFAAALQDPLTVYVALSRSRAPHSVDAQLYFRRMTSLLAARGETLTAFIRRIDPRARYAAQFLLRAHAYDALLPYLNRRPDEAGEAADFLFPENTREIRAHAAQLEGLMAELSARGRRSGALAAFVDRLQARAEYASPACAARIALFLKLNQGLLPPALRPEARAAARFLPPGLLENAGLAPPLPSEAWPPGRWTFYLHFATTSSYTGWLDRFEARGWDLRDRKADEALLVKSFGGLEVRLIGRLHPGDKDGFLRGAQARAFLREVSGELRDPAVQGVILRNHAQFRAVALFPKTGAADKLLLDGSCRSAWDLQALRRRCPACSFVVNTGTGFGRVNNAAVAAVIEGLARGRDWAQIGRDWSRVMPRDASRMQGPWTPAYDEGLALLEARERASRRAPNELYSAKPGANRAGG